MSTRKNILTACSAAALAIGLAACGGGSKVASNTPPSLMLDGVGAAAIDENMAGTTGVTVTATDEQGDEITYVVSNGFDVVNGMLVVVAGMELDYEEASSVPVTITASDGDASSEPQTVNVMVGNVDDQAPTVSISGTRGNIIEGKYGSTGLTVTLSDNDDMRNMGMGNLEYTVTEGFDLIHLGKGEYELVVLKDHELDREDMPEVVVTVTVTDPDNEDSPARTPSLTIAVGGVNDNIPVLEVKGTGAINENATGKTGIFFLPSDADGDEGLDLHVIGDNSESFRVVYAGRGEYELQVTEGFDYESLESGGSVDVMVEVMDNAGLSSTETVSVMVNDLNDNAPVVTQMGDAAIDEETTGSTKAQFTVMDADSVDSDTTWRVTGSDGMVDPRFSIDADGELVLNAGHEFDYDGEMGVMSVTVMVSASDGVNTSEPETVTVDINPVNDNEPVITVDTTAQMRRNEGTYGADDDRSIGVKVTVMDGDNDMVSPMLSETSDDRFTIDADGNLMIAAGSEFDYETMADQSIMLMITARDDGGLEADTQTVTVMFMDLNDTPPMLTVTDNKGGAALKVVTRDEGTVSVNTPTDHLVVVSDDDSGDDPTPMVSDTDRFEIDENGYLTIKADSVFDHETEDSIALVITADDGVNTAATYTITFNIANVDEDPEVTAATTHGMDGLRPEIVMGPYGNGGDITTLTAIDPDNPDAPLANVTWHRVNPDADHMSWQPNANGDMYTLRMDGRTTSNSTQVPSWLGWRGPPTNPRHPTAPPSQSRFGGVYTGYTADNAGTLRTHIVDADDGNFQERVIVQITQKVDQIETSPELAEARKYTVKPTKAHLDEATAAEQAMGKPGNESFYPGFDDLTNNDFINPLTDPAGGAHRRLLTDSEVHNGISSAAALATGQQVDGRLGGSRYSDKVDAARVPAITAGNIDMWYDTTGSDDPDSGITPTNQPPVEPAGLDIVADTRTVNVATGEVSQESNQLAIRYRFPRTDDPSADTNYHVDVALIDVDGMVLEEYRAAPGMDAAYEDGGLAQIVPDSPPSAAVTSTRRLDQSVWGADGEWLSGTSPIEVDVTNGVANNADPLDSLTYAKYGFWSYNNTRDCTKCPPMVDNRAGGLRGATAFGLRTTSDNVSSQSHVGAWIGETVAFWGKRDPANGSIAPNTMGSNKGPARVAVDFNTGLVQANMAVGRIGAGYEVFRFEGTLDSDRRGYTASLDTRIGHSVGAIEGLDVSGVGPNAATGQLGDINANYRLNTNTNAPLYNHANLAHDSNNGVKATGELSGGFYGPRDSVGTARSDISTAQHAQAPTETAGTWTVTDVPNSGEATVVIGAFGADLSQNTRVGSAASGSGLWNTALQAPNALSVGDFGLIVDN